MQATSTILRVVQILPLAFGAGDQECGVPIGVDGVHGDAHLSLNCNILSQVVAHSSFPWLSLL